MAVLLKRMLGVCRDRCELRAVSCASASWQGDVRLFPWCLEGAGMLPRPLHVCMRSARYSRYSRHGRQVRTRGLGRWPVACSPTQGGRSGTIKTTPAPLVASRAQWSASTRAPRRAAGCGRLPVKPRDMSSPAHTLCQRVVRRVWLLRLGRPSEAQLAQLSTFRHLKMLA
jgi:hypothetical protein